MSLETREQCFGYINIMLQIHHRNAYKNPFPLELFRKFQVLSLSVGRLFVGHDPLPLSWCIGCELFRFLVVIPQDFSFGEKTQKIIVILALPTDMILVDDDV